MSENNFWEHRRIGGVFPGCPFKIPTTWRFILHEVPGSSRLYLAFPEYRCFFREVAYLKLLYIYIYIREISELVPLHVFPAQNLQEGCGETRRLGILRPLAWRWSWVRATSPSRLGPERSKSTGLGNDLGWGFWIYPFK